MRTLQLREIYTPPESIAGLFPDATWIDRVVPDGQDCLVLKPDGTPLLCVLRHAVADTLYAATYSAVAPLARSTSIQDNRGVAAGRITTISREALGPSLASGQAGKRSAMRYQVLLLNGKVSKTSRGKPVPSFVAGFVERAPRFPYCRQTAYTNHHHEQTQALLPCLALLSRLFQQYLPARYAAQAHAVAKTSTDFVLPGSVFTTITVNRNWQTACHKDAGDLAAGFGVMLCLRSGAYTGGLYVMPAYRIAVDLQAGDVLLSDVHEWHGNTPLVGDANRYERITMVCYYRAKMIHCGTAAEELARIKRGSKAESV